VREVRWYDGVPPVVAELAVDDLRVHRILWRRGRLALLDHPDRTGELALAALGAERCACFDVLDAWRTRPREVVWRAREWGGASIRSSGPAVGTTAILRTRHVPSRGPVAPRTSRRGALQQFSPFLGMPPSIPKQIAEHRANWLRDQMLALLPPALVERMALALLVHEQRAPDAASVLPLLDMRTHVVDALDRCIRSWGPHRRPPTVDLDLWVTDAAGPDVVGLVERDLGFVVAVLPQRWLLAVYARGLPVVDDCFVLDARLHRADAGEVDAVRLDRSGPAHWTPVTLTFPVRRTPTGTWHLTT
jgi:hypothetical protein